MTNKVQWRPLVAAGAVAALVTLGGTAIYPKVSQAVDNLPSIVQTTPVTPTNPTDAGKPGQANQGQTARQNRSALLADALGISTDKLQAAYQKAGAAAIDKALADQLITKAQADALKQRLVAAGTNGLPGFALFGGRGFFGGTVDTRALLADALGISVADLTTAEQKAQMAVIDQAVTAGNLTQEQGDMAKAWLGYQNYWSAQRGTFAESVDKALKAGAITQAQADLLKQNAQSFAGMGGRGMMGQGMGDFDGMNPGMGGRRGHGFGDDFQNGEGQQFGPGMGEQRGGMPGMGGRRGGMPGMFGMPGSNGQQNQPNGSNNSQGNSGLVNPDASF